MLDHRDQSNIVLLKHHLDRRIVGNVATHTIKLVHQDDIDLGIGLCPVKHFLKLWAFDRPSRFTLLFVDTIWCKIPVVIHSVLLARLDLRRDTEFSFGLTRGRDTAVD
ncbi:hypothetical protein HY839_02440 [Candidatus Azambacteria bacterium]|nr:hypothetical protein [Candidatus Azambacteria bacterium]